MEHGGKKLVIKNGRRRFKSIIAAYVSGKLPLHKIVHPSRITEKRLRHLMNDLDLNSYPKVVGRPLRANRRKRPLLRDYINGTVPVTAIMAPEKITDISAKKEERKKIAQVQNFSDGQDLYRSVSQTNSRHVKSWWQSMAYSTATSSSDESSSPFSPENNDTKNDTRRITARSHSSEQFDESTKAAKTGTIPTTSALGTSIWTSIAGMNTEGSRATTRTDLTIDDVEKEANDDKNLDSDSTVEGERQSTKDDHFISIKEELLPGEGDIKSKRSPDEKKWSINATEPSLSPMHLQKYFVRLLKNHEYIEQRLLRQIICLRKDRDRYRNSYNNLRKIHKILADKWYQFRKISID